MKTTHPERFDAWKYYPDNKVIPSPLQLENYGQFNLSGYGIQKGDVVLYHQLHSTHVRANNGLFNHATIVIGDGVLTDRYHNKNIP